MEPIYPILLFFLILFFVHCVVQFLRDREQRFHTVTWAYIFALWFAYLHVRAVVVYIVIRLINGEEVAPDLASAGTEAVLLSSLPELVAIVVTRIRKYDSVPPIDNHRAAIRRQNHLSNHFDFTRHAERRQDLRRMAWLLGVAGFLATATIALHFTLADPVTTQGDTRMDAIQTGAWRAMFVSALVLLAYIVYYMTRGYRAPLPPDPFTDSLPRKAPPTNNPVLRGRGLSTSEDAERYWMDEQ